MRETSRDTDKKSCVNNYLTWANQTRILAQNFEQLGAVIGGVLINAFKPFVQALNSVMGSIINFAQVVSDALGAIFGWTYQTGGGVTQDFELAAGAAEDLEDATGGAAKNAKELNKYIAPWHEVNNMTTDEGSKGGGGGGGGGSGSALPNADGGNWVQGESLWEKYTSDIDSLYELGSYISNVLTQAMNDIDWESVYQSASNFGQGLALFLNGLITPGLFGALGTTIAGSLNTALHALDSFGTTFDWVNFGESIATGINNFFSTFDFGLLADTLNTWAQGLWTALRTALTKIDWKTVISGLWDFLSNIEIETIGIIIGFATIKKIGKFIFGGALLKELAATFGIRLAGELGSAPVITTIRAAIQALLGNAAARSSLVFMFPKTAAVVSAISGFFSGTVIPAITAGIASIGTAVTGAITALAGVLGVSVTAAGAIVVAAIVAAIAAITAVVLNWDEIKNFFTKTIPTWWSGTVLPFFQNIPENLGIIWENVKNGAIEKWNLLVEFMTSLPDVIGEIVSNIANWFTEMSGNIGYALGYALGSIAGWAVDVFNTLKEKIPEIVTSVATWFSELPGKAYTAISTFLTNVSTWASETLAAFQTGISNIINNVATWFSELPGKVYNEIIKIKDKIVEWKDNAIRFFEENVPLIVDKVIEFFEELPEAIVEVGENLIKGLWEGINNMTDWIGTNISGFVNGIIDGFKEGFDEHSPSKVAFEIGDFFTLGLANGIFERFKDVYRMIGDFTDGISSTQISIPIVDLSVDTSKYQVQPPKINPSEISGQVQEAVKYAFTVGGLIDYNRLGEAVYQGQSQAMQENPVKIGDKDIYSATKRQQQREWRRTHRVGLAGID